MLKIGILASGRGTNMQAIIDSINRGELEAEVGVVISDRNEAGALKRAKKHKVKNYFLDPGRFKSRKEFEKELVGILEENQIGLVVLAGFMRILSPFFISHYRNRVINIHPSLLPSFPGLEAQKQALEYGVKISGCTVHFADEGMDTGPIILQESVPVMEDDTVETLSKRILEKEHRIYPRAIKLYSEGRLKIIDGVVKIIERK